MATITDSVICEMEGKNKIIGYYPLPRNSTITFSGENNILYCDKNVRLVDTTLNFAGDNSIIFLGSNRFYYKLHVDIYNDSVFHMGKDNYINQKMTVIVTEQKHCFIGDYGIFSTNIKIRNSDPHLIYNCSTGQRINLSKSIYLGDHIWLGQDVSLLKGTQIDSGSIVGASSVVSGKKIPSNTAWAGSPCRKVSENIFWDGAYVHSWLQERTEISMQYSDYIAAYKHDCHDDYWIYNYNPDECLEWDELDKKLSCPYSALEKLEYLLQLSENKGKNIFVHKH